MHIIGTAGHVDHGKTALIEALTGINADRLPEEKKRGMTIDLGFAHFEGDDGEPVGVIDVPGHERFIRNMVAGAWSLSCGVLVVAANEGWMQQTEDHALVLEAMEIPAILCALTKSDLVEEPELLFYREQVEENLKRIFGREIGILPVSSHTGEGVAELRRSVLERLKHLHREEPAGGAYLHVDRSFTIKGAGTVVTGSLAGGELKEGDELTILPGGQKTRVRGIQSYYSGVNAAFPVSRVACNLQGIKREEVSRGCLAAGNPGDFSCEKEYIIRWEQQETRGKKIKNHMELEIACGTGHYTGRIHFLKVEGFARIVLNEPVPAARLDPMVFIRQGGHHILGRGRFIRAGVTDRRFRINLSDVLRQYPEAALIPESSVLEFLLNGWVEPPAAEEWRAVEAFAADRELAILSVAGVLLQKECYAAEAERLEKLCSRPGGAAYVEYIRSGELPVPVKEQLIEAGVKEERLLRKEQLLISADQSGGRIELTPLGKNILRQLSRQKNRGLQLKEIRQPGAKTELRSLCRLGKVVALEAEIYFSISYFNKLVESILEGLESGSSFTIPEAKEKTGLSRRYIIPLLNRMEEMGLVRRDGDLRIVS